MSSTLHVSPRAILWSALAALCALGCATARPPLAASWCANEDDKACGQRYAALFAHSDLFAADDGNREGMVSWFRYRCALDPSSNEAAAGANEPGLDCWRAGQIELAQGKAAEARKLEERGCEEFAFADACVLAGAFAHEKFELREAHDWECRGKRAAEEHGTPAKELEAVDCRSGADTRARLQVAEQEKLGRPASANMVQCALRGCVLPSGRRVNPWITSW